MATSTSRAAATSFILAGLAAIASHRCRSWGVDGGGEGQGAQHQNGRAGHASNENGFGSYRNSLEVTREGYEQAMAKVQGRSHIELCDESIWRTSRRSPRTLGKIHCEDAHACTAIHVLSKGAGDPRERHVVRDGSTRVDRELHQRDLTLSSKYASRRLPCMAMVKGGVALVFDCTKHLAHTAK